MSDANVAPSLATNVMLSEWDTFCALSVEMEPLRSANDVGVLLQAMRQYPAGLPDRVILIAAELPAYSTQQIALLLARLDTVGIGLVQTSSRLADTGQQVHLLPPPTTCVVCGEPGLMVDRKPSGAVRPPSSPTVVSERGILQGILHSKTCGKCGALHGMSYADGGSGLPSGKQMPYEGATARGSRWCQMSSKVVWENSLLYAFESQAVFSHTGYETFASEYEWKHGGHDVSQHLRRSLAHSWLAWSLLRWLEELELPVAPLGLSTDEELDASLLEAMHKERGLVYSFVDKWGRLHEMVCRKPKPGHPWCMCYIIDGHMKCKRCALRSVPNPTPTLALTLALTLTLTLTRAQACVRQRQRAQGQVWRDWHGGAWLQRQADARLAVLQGLPPLRRTPHAHAAALGQPGQHRGHLRAPAAQGRAGPAHRDHLRYCWARQQCAVRAMRPGAVQLHDRRCPGPGACGGAEGPHFARRPPRCRSGGAPPAARAR